MKDYWTLNFEKFLRIASICWAKTSSSQNSRIQFELMSTFLTVLVDVNPDKDAPWPLWTTEWVVCRYSSKYVFLKILQISQENICVSLFLINVHGLRPPTLLKRDSNTVAFLWNFSIFKNVFFCRTPPVAAFGTKPVLTQILLIK